MAKIIALDAGHGLKTAGKQTLDGSRGVIKEWTMNDKVRDYIVDDLEEYDVKFIYPDNNEGIVDESLKSRLNSYVNKADIMVSIHHNAYQSKWGNHTGVEVWADKNATSNDMKFAQLVHDKLAKYTGLRARGVKKENWAVINQNKVTAILIEGGFMDSTIDYDVITSDEGQKAYARAVSESIIEFLKLEKEKVETKKPFFTSKGYFSYGDVHTNIGKIAKFMRKTFPSYTPKEALGNYYGPNIKKSIKEFQKRTGLEADGCVGPITLCELIKYGFTY